MSYGSNEINHFVIWIILITNAINMLLALWLIPILLGAIIEQDAGLISFVIGLTQLAVAIVVSGMVIRKSMKILA
jgi:hypothetical protein